MTRRNLGPLALYAALSILLFGIPVLGHFASRIIASDDIDSSQFMWFFAWWPHALLHGEDPLVTHAIFYPSGFNLTWATAMPGPALLLAPVTELANAAATWNVMQLAAPALSAWAMFLLCRHLTGRLWPSLVGGYVFGFSPYMLVHLTGGPYLALVPLVPVFVLLVLRRLAGTLGARRFVVLMALALAGQYLISSEVLTTATLFGAVGLACAFAVYPDRRAALLDLVKLLGLAYVALAILISPFLAVFFLGHQYPPGATYFSADVVSFGLPPSLVALGRQSPPFGGSNTESYLGLPLILLIAVFAWQGRRARATWMLVGPLLVTAVLSLGGYLFVRGKLTSVPAPWLVLHHLPVLRYAIPIRFALFVVLPAALILARWLADSAARWPWVLAALVVVSILPDVGSRAWNTPIHDPPFFAAQTYRSYLKPSDHVLTIPAWGPNERWQADTGFRFTLSDGYAGNPFPPAYTRFATWNTLLTGRLTPDYAAQLRRFVAAKSVSAIVVDQHDPGPWRQLFDSLGVRPISVGGVWFYRL